MCQLEIKFTANIFDETNTYSVCVFVCVCARVRACANIVNVDPPIEILF